VFAENGMTAAGSNRFGRTQVSERIAGISEHATRSDQQVVLGMEASIFGGSSRRTEIALASRTRDSRAYDFGAVERN